MKNSSKCGFGGLCRIFKCIKSEIMLSRSGVDANGGNGRVMLSFFLAAITSDREEEAVAMKPDTGLSSWVGPHDGLVDTADQCEL